MDSASEGKRQKRKKKKKKKKKRKRKKKKKKRESGNWTFVSFRISSTRSHKLLKEKKE